MVGLTDAEWWFVDRFLLHGPKQYIEATSAQYAAGEELLRRGIVCITRTFREADAEVYVIDLTPVGRVVYRVERAIREGHGVVL